MRTITRKKYRSTKLAILSNTSFTVQCFALSIVCKIVFISMATPDDTFSSNSIEKTIQPYVNIAINNSSSMDSSKFKMNLSSNFNQTLDIENLPWSTENDSTTSTELPKVLGNSNENIFVAQPNLVPEFALAPSPTMGSYLVKIMEANVSAKIKSNETNHPLMTSTINRGINEISSTNDRNTLSSGLKSSARDIFPTPKKYFWSNDIPHRQLHTRLDFNKSINGAVPLIIQKNSSNQTQFKGSLDEISITGPSITESDTLMGPLDEKIFSVKPMEVFSDKLYKDPANGTLHSDNKELSMEDKAEVISIAKEKQVWAQGAGVPHSLEGRASPSIHGMFEIPHESQQLSENIGEIAEKFRRIENDFTGAQIEDLANKSIVISNKNYNEHSIDFSISGFKSATQNEKPKDLMNFGDDEDNNKAHSSGRNVNGTERELEINNLEKSRVASHLQCISNGKSFENGEAIERDCDERCVCSQGNWICTPRCTDSNFRRKSKEIPENCREIPIKDDICCSKLECNNRPLNPKLHTTELSDTYQNTARSQHYVCHFNGGVYKLRERIEIGCNQICHCDQGGVMNCRPRCLQQNQTATDKCVFVKDPKDVCCQLELCDVTLDDHEQRPPISTPLNAVSSNEQIMAIEHTQNMTSMLHECEFKNQSYRYGQQFHDGCDKLCLCTKDGIHCTKLQCPSAFGLEILSPNCLNWETDPSDFTPIPPNCCPERMRCADNETCEYQGEIFDNSTLLPKNLTGCERNCYCLRGKIDCRPACPPIVAVPPSDLPCNLAEARLLPISDDNCCKQWACLTTESNNPKADVFQYRTENVNGFQNISPSVEVLSLEAIDAHTIRIVLTVPQAYVNLHGRIELRFSNKPSNDEAHWEQLTFAPPEDLIATSQMEFDLPGLEENSIYKIKITLVLRDLNSQPSSRVYEVKTPADRQITPPPEVTYFHHDLKDIFEYIKDLDLNASQTNSTWIKLTWKKLPEMFLEHIDGIQLRYKELDGLIFCFSALIHRTVTSYLIENLIPDTSYEFSLYYIPLTGQAPQFHAGQDLVVRTIPKVDLYEFEVRIYVVKVKAQTIEVSWSGVPYPEDKYINIYRAIYLSDAGKEDSSVFKVAKRDSTTGTIIMDLNPRTKYTLWLEIYLTNGHIKKSNVVNFETKSMVAADLSKNGKLFSATADQNVSDYYGPLVAVSVVAALSIMSTVLLLLMLTRRRAHQTASITPQNKNDVSYDNPSYKVEIQQETLNL